MLLNKLPLSKTSSFRSSGLWPLNQFVYSDEDSEVAKSNNSPAAVAEQEALDITLTPPLLKNLSLLTDIRP